MAQLKKTERLDLSNYVFGKYSWVAFKLTTLKELNLSGNETIEPLPISLENLSTLKKLDVSNCRLTYYPEVPI